MRGKERPRERETARVCVCVRAVGGGATKVCTIFLSVCLLIHGNVGLIDEIKLLCG